jgi:hypothetical protein
VGKVYKGNRPRRPSLETAEAWRRRCRCRCRSLGPPAQLQSLHRRPIPPLLQGKLVLSAVRVSRASLQDAKPTSSPLLHASLLSPQHLPIRIYSAPTTVFDSISISIGTGDDSRIASSCFQSLEPFCHSTILPFCHSALGRVRS